ncbi:MAG: SDR family NAD(P)-dependent oxidoreductase [Bacteroidota bacterium]
MKHVVITGGTRGIGFGLASSFVRQGFRTSITGRDLENVQKAVSKLSELAASAEVNGFVCDITVPDQVRTVWEQASALSRIDIWINNAGAGHATLNFSELDEAQIRSVLRTNLEGTMLTTRIVMQGMAAQGSGMIYLMEGFGSDGRIMNGMSVYGTSKNALRYFARSVIAEARGGTVGICTLSPGMVVTDLLTGPVREDTPLNRSALRIFNILADEVETVTPWLVKKIAANTKHGASISWLTGRKIMLRVIGNMFRKRQLESLRNLH